jgi:hypothetical protein
MGSGPCWNNHTCGQGVGSAPGLLPNLQRLVERMAQPDWVAEEPDAHLLPHLRRASEHAGSRLRLVAVAVAPDGTYLVDLAWTGEPPSRRDQREAVFALIGALAEPATYVRERPCEGGVEFEVATGVLAGDGPFQSHGHTVRLRLTTPPPAA